MLRDSAKNGLVKPYFAPVSVSSAMIAIYAPAGQPPYMNPVDKMKLKSLKNL